MLMEDATEAEKDLQALEILLGDKIAFTVGETAKILGRSVRWVLQKTASGKLASARIGAQRRILRPTIIRALRRASNSRVVERRKRSAAPEFTQHT